VGAGPNSRDQLYRSLSNGKWARANLPIPADQPTLFEHTDASWIDWDQDGDLDLTTTGRNLRGGGKVSIYQNDEGFLTPIDGYPFLEDKRNATCLAWMDLNEDGVPDLFVGRSSDPGSYGLARSSSLWLSSGPGQWQALDSKELELGMVNDVVWDSEEKTLVVVGDWTPVWSLRWDGQELQRQEIGPKGWWQHIALTHVGGTPHYFLGNWGSNVPFTASREEPLRLYLQDLNKDQRIDPIFSHYAEGKEYPFFGKDRLVKQVNQLKRNYVEYADFAQATVHEVFPSLSKGRGLILECETLESGFLALSGDWKPLSVLGQSPIQASLELNDKNLLGVGNFYACQPSIGQCDAQASWWWSTDQGRLEPSQTGLRLQGDFRDVALVRSSKGDQYVLAVQQDGPLKAFLVLD